MLEDREIVEILNSCYKIVCESNPGGIVDKDKILSSPVFTSLVGFKIQSAIEAKKPQQLNG
jgi:hypothetical protein